MKSNRYTLIVILEYEQARDDMLSYSWNNATHHQRLPGNTFDPILWSEMQVSKSLSEEHNMEALFHSHWLLLSKTIINKINKCLALAFHVFVFCVEFNIRMPQNVLLLTWVYLWLNYIKASCVWFHDQTTGQSWVARCFRGDCVVWSKRYGNSTATGRHS